MSGARPAYKIAVIGGGAAGFFSAINIKILAPACEVTILEKSNKVLSKVRISGGGRCNVTHHCFDNTLLVSNYPRGNKELRQVFARFGVEDTIRWFASQGVRLKTESDGRMFPQNDSSQTIIDCFMDLASKLNIGVKMFTEVYAIQKTESGIVLKTAGGYTGYNKVVCASGGFPKPSGYDFIRNTGHKIDPPVPSLFTFNFPAENIRKELQGVVAGNARVSLRGGKHSCSGPLLVTHWGISGPAVLKLSAFEAVAFHQADYRTEIRVNWVNEGREKIASRIKELQNDRKKSLPANTPAFGLPARLWEFLCGGAGIRPGATWAETGKKQTESLVALLFESRYQMEGKSTFKEEFVTCGGVNLKEVDFRSMESKVMPGLYFCGEALNIDAITGGFNFQAAWSTAYVCASAIAAEIQAEEL